MTDSSGPETRLALPVDPARDHIRGPAGAAVTLLEYADFECPSCRDAHEVIGEVLAEAGDEVRFVFRNFPLTALHPHAQRAAEAAEAAGAQGDFWEMHDLLFEQERLDDRIIVTLAHSLGLDLDRFGRSLTTRAHAARVRADVQSGVNSGVSSTPSFFINGLLHEGPWDRDALLAALRAAIDLGGELEV